MPTKGRTSHQNERGESNRLTASDPHTAPRGLVAPLGLRTLFVLARSTAVIVSLRHTVSSRHYIVATGELRPLNAFSRLLSIAPLRTVI